MRDLDQRTNTYREAEANLRAAEAAVQTAKLDLGYTEVRAPRRRAYRPARRHRRQSGGGWPDLAVLTTLVSVDPIYVGFDADENAVADALASIGDADVLSHIDQIPWRSPPPAPVARRCAASCSSSTIR